MVKVSTTALLAAMVSAYNSGRSSLYRHYNPGPTSEAITVPILPRSLQHEALLHNHDVMHLVQNIRGETRHLSDSALRLIGLAWQPLPGMH